MRDARRARVVLAVLVLISVSLIILDLRGSEDGPLGPLRTFGENVIGPIERGAAAIVVPVRNLFTGIGSLGSKDDQIAQLQEQNAALKARLDTIAGDVARVGQFEDLMGIANANDYEVVPAQIIAVGPAQGFSWTVTIDAGSRDGVEKDMSVISGKGLVGRILSVGPSTSTVVLVIDATSSVGGRLEGSAQIGIVSGTGRQDALQMQLLDPLAQVSQGDVIVTFGSEGGRPYAPGIPVGTVAEVKGTPGQLTRNAVVTPYVDMSTLDIVGVVLASPERRVREPVIPTPSPTPTPSTSEGQ